MKILLGAILATVAAVAQDFKAEIELAFLQFDSDGDGYVTKHEMIEAVMKDLTKAEFSEQDMTLMLEVIEVMSQQHDKEQDGFDFLELYTASGGLLQEF